MKPKKLIKKASIVLSAAVLTAVSFSVNLIDIRPITAEALNMDKGIVSDDYTYNKASLNPVTGTTNFTIKNVAWKWYSTETDSYYYPTYCLYDSERDILFLNNIDATKPDNEFYSILDRIKNRDSHAFSYAYRKNSKNALWGDEQVGAMYQFEQIYDYFYNHYSGYCPNGTLVISDVGNPGQAFSKRSYNYIEFCRKTDKSENAAKEIGVIAHEYGH